MDKNSFKNHLWCEVWSKVPNYNFYTKCFFIFRETPEDFKTADCLVTEMVNRYNKINDCGYCDGIMAKTNDITLIDENVPYFKCDPHHNTIINFGLYASEITVFRRKLIDQNSESKTPELVHSPEEKEECKSSMGYKHDSGKARFDLIPTDALYMLSLLYTYGAKKYPERNWEKGMNWSQLYSAAQRHLSHFWNKEDIDPEFNLPHLVHAACNILNLVAYHIRGVGTDDRPDCNSSIEEIRKTFEPFYTNNEENDNEKG